MKINAQKLMISTQKMLRRNALLQKMLLLKCTDFLIEKKKINDELIRILTLITIYFLLVELETIKKNKNIILFSLKEVVNSPQNSATRLLTLTYSWRFLTPFLIKSHPI